VTPTLRVARAVAYAQSTRSRHAVERCGRWCKLVASVLAGGRTLTGDLVGFGDLLRRHRVAAGLTQEALAERAGLSLRGLSDLERGARRSPYRDTAVRLAEALGLSGAERAALLDATRRTGPRPLVRPEGASAAGLAVPLSSFVGREHELAEVRRLLGQTRFLTLVGTGGVGKTRLAVAAAERHAADTGMAAAFFDLAPLTDPQLVLQTVASGLGVREQARQPVLATLVTALRNAELLVLLDNCEHIVEGCASLARALLQACPGLRLLATSREALGIAGETVWRVPSLALPQRHAPLDQVAAADAVRLFLERARAVQSDFQLSQHNESAVAAVCRRLDGIPLALELAAAHAPILSIEQLNGRLYDGLGLLTRGSRLAPARQQTVRATIDWSYGLLTEPERLLFDLLAVFSGGWTLEAAEAVAGADGLEPREVLRLLGRLVDTSLVLVESGPVGPVRYRLLEPMRQYGLECLVRRGADAAAQRRHAEFFVAFGAEVEPAMINGAAGGWTAALAVAALEREHDNLRTALQWLLGQDELMDDAQRLAGVFGRFCFQRGYVVEGETWLARALATPSGDRPTVGRAKCLFARGTLALTRGDYAGVESDVGEALILWQRLGVGSEECWSLFVLGFVARRRGDYTKAREYLEAGVERSRAANQGGAESSCLRALAEVAADLGDDAEARSLAEAALVRATEAGWGLSLIVARRILGALSVREGEYAIGQASLEASLAEARRLGMPWWTAETLVSLGVAALEQGALGLARRCLAESLAVTRELDDQFGLAGALEAFAVLAVALGEPRQALQFMGAAAALREAVGTPLPPAERPRLERLLTPARSALGQPATDEAQAEGRALPLSGVLDRAARTAADAVDPEA
jgi:predicted ATPase/DNA-binding XRE family transcriptional regulator